jgi:hypothetical protein
MAWVQGATVHGSAQASDWTCIDSPPSEENRARARDEEAKPQKIDIPSWSSGWNLEKPSAGELKTVHGRPRGSRDRCVAGSSQCRALAIGRAIIILIPILCTHQRPIWPCLVHCLRLSSAVFRSILRPLSALAARLATYTGTWLGLSALLALVLVLCRLGTISCTHYPPGTSPLPRQPLHPAHTACLTALACPGLPWPARLTVPAPSLPRLRKSAFERACCSGSAGLDSFLACLRHS